MKKMKNKIYPSSDLLINVGKTKLGKEVYFNLLDDFFSNFGFYINIGGDIYDFPYTFEFIDYANKKGVKSIGVYASRLTLEYAKKFSKQKVRAIMFPLQSINKIANDKILGRGSYKRTMAGVRIAKKYGLGTEIITVADKNALIEIPKIVKFMEKNEIDLLVVARSIMKRYYHLNLKQFPYSKYKDLLDYLVKENTRLRENGDGKISLMSCPHKILLDNTLEEIGVMGGCSGGSISCYISQKGTVHPCAALDKLVVGNIKKERFSDIWRESKIFREFRTRDKLKGKCGDCKYKFKCGGCRADAYYKYHDLWVEDPNCWI